MIFLLEAQNTKTNEWIVRGVYSTYKKARDVLIHQIGIHRVRNVELDKDLEE